MIFSLLLGYLFLHGAFGASPRIDPLVNVAQGLIRGRQASDGDYAYFLGVPYAQVGAANPFGPAQPHPEFEGIFDAYYASVQCPQTSRDGSITEQTLDCLTLNIAVPNEASSLNPLPVLIYLHGGGFTFGSGNNFHAPNIVKNGIIVVTVNYRLGPYGFMCLDTPNVPGNQGIKDQYEALLWVRNNIAAFGGNPYDVTLGGESAGSACVLYHLYSPNDKLFRKVIVQSDTPQNEGIFVKKDVNAAIKLAGHLGLETNDSGEAVQFLSRISPDLIVGASQDLGLQFKPCKEEAFDGVNNIITSDPFSLSNQRNIRNTPVLIGHTTREHMGVLLEMYGANYLNSDPFRNKLNDWFDLDDAVLAEAANTVRHFYIGDEELNEGLLPVLENFDSDFVFNHPIQRTVTNLLNQNAGPVFQYLFSYTGDSGETAVGHAAENKYLFDNGDISQSEGDQLMVHKVTMLWSNFVKNGNPTPQVNDLLPVTWAPALSDTRPYLVIDEDLRLESRVFNDRMAFWDLFYSIYGKYNRYIDA